MYYSTRKLRKRLEAHEYNGKKFYINKGFEEKITINLANICSSPDDEFSLIDVGYEAKEFDCELDGHKHCLFFFIVQNNKTKKKMKVGSECIHHFKNRGVDIDLAEGLMKRVAKATNQAKADLHKKLGQEAWDALPDEEKLKVSYYERNDFIKDLGRKVFKTIPKDKKALITIREFMRIQAEELLLGVANNKYILSTKEIEHILSLDMNEKLEKALERQKEHERQEEIRNIRVKIREYFDEIIEKNIELNTETVENFRLSLKELNYEYADYDIDSSIDNIDSMRTAKKREDLLDSIHDYIDILKKNWQEPDYETIKQLKKEAEEFNDIYDNDIDFIFSKYIKEKEKYIKYQFLYDYKGNNDIVVDIKNQSVYKELTEKQIDYARRLIEVENGTVKENPAFNKAITFLVNKFPDNNFYKSINAYYLKNNFVSEKQTKYILKDYEKAIK